MLVYGDRTRTVDPRSLARTVEHRGREAAAAEGPARLDLLTEALIAAGELAQGVADAAFDASGADGCTPETAATMDLAVAAAGRLLRAAGRPEAAPDVGEALAGVARAGLPPSIRCKNPEGFAFYALYPEHYAEAAAALAPLGRPQLVIGLRSIGTSLAASAAARLGCSAISLRPTGHPYRRELRLSDSLRARLAAHPGAFIVVDEGPGRSGSSFGAAGDLLESLGASSERIFFVSGHDGALGPEAQARHRARWAQAQRRAGGDGPSEATVADWFADVVGAASVEDLSGGGWRRGLAPDAWLPAAPVAERRKVRLTTASGRYLARFAGLGGIGEAKLGVARRLHAAGFVPEPLALRRGFLLERWVEGARLDASAGRDRRLVAHLGRYLGLRAQAFPALPGDGASYAELRTMAGHNAGELGGPDLRGAVEARLAALGEIDGLAPIRVDGRLHAWEWLRLPDGGLCKTDALDHASGHDLVGCQDVAWDIAGAAVEFDLAEAAVEDLRAAIGAARGREVSRQTIAAFRICYAAFQAGYWSMLGEAATEGADRSAAQRGRYVSALLRSAQDVAGPCPARPRRGQGRGLDAADETGLARP